MVEQQQQQQLQQNQQTQNTEHDDTAVPDQINRDELTNQKVKMQMVYLENENENLGMENADLNATLKINKQIIKSLLEGDQRFDQQVEYTIAQITQENEMWESRVKSLTEQRDRLQAELLLQEQIICNTKDKEDDIADIYKDEIEELQENLERKEFLLQLAEQRVAAFEKLLMNLGQRDPEVQKKLNEQKIVLKDRKISNVIIENEELRDTNANLLQQNSEMREQLENVLDQLQKGQGADPALVEEISIFQNKLSTSIAPNKILDKVKKKVGVDGMTSSEKHDLGGEALGSITESRGGFGMTASSTMYAVNQETKDYIKKLEHSVTWLEEKLAKAKNDQKQMKKEFDSLKDSNENHIFINEKLNKALKRMEDRNEKLTDKLRQITNESVVLPKKKVTQDSNPSEAERPQVTVGASRAAGAVIDTLKGGDSSAFGEPNDDIFLGDMSSIMIKPDQIMNDQNLND